MKETKLYSSRIVTIYLNLLKTRYPLIDPAPLLDYAGIKPYEATDGACWFTQRQVDRFNERLVQLTGNPNIAREGGRYAASRESLGFTGKYLLGLIGPANAFFAINKSSSSFTRSSHFETRRLAPNKVEITVTPLPGVEERPFQCDNRIGFFEAMLASFRCDLPAIEHPECVFKGGASCRYVVSWRGALPSRLRAARNYLALALLPCLFFLPPFVPFPALTLLPACLCGFLAASLLASHLEKQELHAALGNLKESTDELLEQNSINYNNALMVNEVGQAISMQMDKDQVLRNIIAALEQRLGYDRGMILLANADRTLLSFHVGFGYDEDQLRILQETAFRLDNPYSRGVFVTCFRNQKPFLINEFAKVAPLHSAHSVRIAQQLGAQAFICCAIVCEGESLGVLAMDNVRSKRELVGSDMSLLMSVAPVIGMSIRNAIHIDRERRMAEQLRQSQKMEAIGELASGVAHDFNNLLTAIIGFTTMVRDTLPEESQPFQYLGEVLHASERATYMTRGLLAFGRRHAANPEPVDLNEIVHRMEKLLGRLISRQIELAITPAQGCLTVMADPGQIDQIIMNLATNARDAMNNAGTLTIETGVAEVGAGFIDSRGVGSPGRYATISVRDTGKGMDSETRSRLFEPFFTTKPPGQGTGLGLSIVHGIVQQHGGFIDLVTAPGEGTTFVIHLQLLDGDVVPICGRAPEDVSYTGTETLLVAEDSPEVRKLTVELLRQHGYRIIEAADGREALDKFLAHREEIGLVVMDLVMPRMTGRAAFDAMAKAHPSPNVLFTSAYPPDEVGADAEWLAEAPFLAKPCPPQALLRAVRERIAYAAA